MLGSTIRKMSEKTFYQLFLSERCCHLFAFRRSSTKEIVTMASAAETANSELSTDKKKACPFVIFKEVMIDHQLCGTRRQGSASVHKMHALSVSTLGPQESGIPALFHKHIQTAHKAHKTER